MKASKSLLILTAIAVTSLSNAQLQVQGDETGAINSPIRSAGRTYLAGYENETLTGISGPLTIIGVRFRGSADSNLISAALTASTINFSSFEMVLGLPSSSFATAGEFTNTTSTFSSWTSGLTTVRSGALTMGPNFWQTGQWTPTILFDTPFAYDTTTASGLMFGFAHQGSDSQLDSSNFPAATRDFTNWGSGLGADAIFATNGSGFGATPAGFIDPAIVEFVVVPEPGTMVVLGIGALAMFKRRKTK